MSVTYKFGLLDTEAKKSGTSTGTTTGNTTENTTGNSTGNTTGSSTGNSTSTNSNTTTGTTKSFIEIGLGSNIQIFSNYQSVLTSLYNVAFNRKIYSPNELIVDLVMTVGTEGNSGNDETVKTELAKITNSVLTDRFLDKEVYLSVKGDGKDQKFENLYIHHIIPLREKNTSMFVRIKAYSFDFQLTQKEYCRSYVAKRVYADILNYKPKDENALWINTHLSKSHPITIANNATMQHMQYEVDGVKKEYILPYMVQYNESFYDFMCRTANRCGEFMYFDEGHLFYGVDSTLDKAPLDSSGQSINNFYDSSISYEDCSQSFGKKLDHVDNDYLALSNEVTGTSDLLLSEKDFESNWTRDYESSKSKDLVKNEWSKNAKTNEKTPSDDDFVEMAKKADKMKKSSGADDLKYNFEINEEEHHIKVFKNRFSDTKVGHYVNPMFGSTTVASVLKAGSLYDAIKTLVLAFAKGPLDFVRTNRQLQLRGEEQVYDRFTNGKDYMPINQNLQQKDDAVTPFVAYDGVIKNSDYQKIRKGELYVSEQAMVFNLGTNYKRLKLGQKIKDGSNKEYVVVQIKIKPACNQPKFTTIDSEFPADFNNMSGSHMQVIAVPMAKVGDDKEEKIYPPMHPKGHVRHADPQVAFVPSHGYMDPRTQGRLRIYYPWDESKNASPWLRVMVSSATSGSGTYAEAGPGDEVLVCYFGGNVERPYIGGFLRNKERTLQYKRGDMYMISKNGHGIAFNDPADPSLFFEGLSPTFKLMKSIAHLIPNSSGIFGGGIDAEDSDAKGNQRLINMTGGTTITDAYNIYSISMSSDQRKIDINSPFGKVGINAFTGITISAPNGDISIKGKNVTIEAANSVKIESGKNVKEGRIMGKTPTDPATIMTRIGMDVATGLLPINEAIQPIDMEVLRCVVEMILKPVRGTMQIKSNNYLLLEAGNGKAAISPDKYKDGSKMKTKLKEDTQKVRKNQLAIRSAIEQTNTIIDTAFDQLIPLLNIACDNWENLNERYTNAKNTNRFKKGECLTPEKVRTEIWDKRQNLAANEVNNYKYHGENVKKLNLSHNLTGFDKQSYIKSFEGFAEAYINLIIKIVGFENDPALYARLLPVDGDNEDAYKTTFYPRLEPMIKEVLSDVKNVNGANGEKWSDLSVTPAILLNLKKKYKHKVLAKLLSNNEVQGIIGYENSTNYVVADDNWFEFVKSIKPVSKKDGPLKIIENTFVKCWEDFAAECTERDVWESTSNGQIIFSEYGDSSYYFDETGTMHSYNTGLNDTEYEGKSFKARLLSLQ